MKLSFSELIRHLSDQIRARYLNFKLPFLVGIDGPDCSGKTTIARALVTELKQDLATALHHFDEYLSPKERRDYRGAFSVDAFCFDYFDTNALILGVLAPAIAWKSAAILKPSVVIIEGLFLYRKSTVRFFDYRIRLEASDILILKRASKRDVELLGDEKWVKTHYKTQCIPAQHRYQQQDSPETVADYLICVAGDDEYDISC